jgi:hypothetical protein
MRAGINHLCIDVEVTTKGTFLSMIVFFHYAFPCFKAEGHPYEHALQSSLSRRP